MKKLVLMSLVFAGLATATAGFSSASNLRTVCRWKAYDSEGFLRGAGHYVTGNSRIGREFANIACKASYPGASCDVECDGFGY